MPTSRDTDFEPRTDNAGGLTIDCDPLCVAGHRGL